jgi:hypothetical protein
MWVGFRGVQSKVSQKSGHKNAMQIYPMTMIEVLSLKCIPPGTTNNGRDYYCSYVYNPKEKWGDCGEVFCVFSPDGSKRWPWKVRKIHDWVGVCGVRFSDPGNLLCPFPDDQGNFLLDSGMGGNEVCENGDEGAADEAEEDEVLNVVATIDEIGVEAESGVENGPMV